MRVVHINTTDLGGGAEQVMLALHNQLVKAGYQSACFVGKKQTNLDFVRKLLRPTIIQRALNNIAASQGKEPMAYRNALWQFHRVGFEPDIIHIHNLHGGYFNLNDLVGLSVKCKVFVHLHDMWLLTGHCAQSFDCERWLDGCGNCPDLTIYPAVRKDATDFNWLRKREILSKTRLNFICPSKWMADKLRASGIANQSLSVIPNGVDRGMFVRGDKLAARKALGISPDKKVLLFIARNPEKNEFKDYATLKQAAKQVADEIGDVELVCLGMSGRRIKSEKVGSLTISFHPFTLDRTKVVQYYQAADLYVHAAKAETFGMTIIEAMACGVPVVASNVGGIADIIEHKKTGFLFLRGGAGQLAEMIIELLSSKEKRKEVSYQASEMVAKFDVKRVSKQLIELYHGTRGVRH